MNNVKHFREKAGLSQMGLAVELGISQAAVARWELGISNPSSKRLRQLSEMFGCKIDDLLGKEG